MNLASIIVLAVIAAMAVVAILTIRSNRRKNRCCCGSASGCPGSCASCCSGSGCADTCDYSTVSSRHNQKEGYCTAKKMQ
ncbi:MAG: hypothetical protein HUJ90_06515 [Bacteroidales bacterium]|nr:hypothetical protein [Bacteroidales bacterium]